MPKRKGWVALRIENLTQGAKKIAEKLSPRKKRKQKHQGTGKENSRPTDIISTPSKASTSPSEVSRLNSINASPDDASDIFLTPRVKTFRGLFRQSAATHTPTASPAHSFHQFPVPPSASRRVTVEEVEDDGSVRNFRAGLSSTHLMMMDDDPASSDGSDRDSLQDRDPREQQSPTASPNAAGCSSRSQPEAPLRDGKRREAPNLVISARALADLRIKLRGEARQKDIGLTGNGYKVPEVNPYIKLRLEGMKSLLFFYTDSRSTTYTHWGASSLQAAIGMGRGPHTAKKLRKLVLGYIDNREILPINPYGSWNESMLVDEDLVNDINIYLLELGKEITARKLAQYLARPDVMEKHALITTITERTARRYLHILGYRFTTAKKGQYTDGHERPDVVLYRDKKFLPAWWEIQGRIRSWSKDNLPEAGPHLPGRRVVVWFHDETIFYANDRRRKTWYHKDAPATPYAKGDGASLMIADYVSADFGWLLSLDGRRSARRMIKPGKNRDGYFSSEDIEAQAMDAIDIVTEAYPDFEHVFVYDNATTHLKRPEGSLSARKMPRNTPKNGKNWLLEVTKRSDDGKPVYCADGSFEKVKIPMGDGVFDGKPQSLYFPEGHQRAGVFKGMATILEERGFPVNTEKKLAQCKDFKCPPPALDCCCRRILFNQPDFAEVDSILETSCKARDVKVIFLPKFHCELNFIEQCWGYAKQIYRLNPESSREDQLEKNALAALEAVPIDSMRRFANRSRRFMAAYTIGLNGRQAAWAARKYKGHRVLPENIMDELEKAHVV